MSYPKDCWYVAATSDEIGDGFTARRILDRPLVLFRLADGSIAALEDRCAHRPYPLSAGHRDAGCIDEDATPRRYVNVKADRAPVRARRILTAMVEDERGL